MTSNVTDIKPYQDRKVLERMGDDRIRSRYNFLHSVRDMGPDYDPNKDGQIKDLFPRGFDPENHPEDNIDAIFAEGVRRGVFVS